MRKNRLGTQTTYEHFYSKGGGVHSQFFLWRIFEKFKVFIKKMTRRRKMIMMIFFGR